MIRAASTTETAPRRRKPEATRLPGVIERDAIYTLREFSARTGLGRWAIRQARKAGLAVMVAGGKSFVRGADFFDFLEKSKTK